MVWIIVAALGVAHAAEGSGDQSDVEQLYDVGWTTWRQRPRTVHCGVGLGVATATHLNVNPGWATIDRAAVFMDISPQILGRCAFGGTHRFGMTLQSAPFIRRYTTPVREHYVSLGLGYELSRNHLTWGLYGITGLTVHGVQSRLAWDVAKRHQVEVTAVVAFMTPTIEVAAGWSFLLGRYRVRPVVRGLQDSL